MKTIILASLIAACTLQSAAAFDPDPAAGEGRFTQNCVSCHGKAGKGVAEFPALAGRDADYITHRLTQYRAKEKVGYDSAVMYSMAGELTDEEISNLAAYISPTFK